jgi:glycosyltransferase involved in cell wall biosynthesis
LTISNFSKKRIIKEYPKVSSKIDVIHHGLSTYFKDSCVQKEDYILYVGAINEIKNFQTVLELFMSDELCDIPLKMILANSDSFTQSDEVKDLLLDSKSFKNIEIIYKVSQKSLIEYYQKAKIFLFPSFHESFGFPPLEAMACGTPAIVSNVTALPEICKDAALYIEPNDKDDIKNKLLKLYYDEWLQKDFTTKGLLRAGEFDWKESADKHLEIFKEVTFR